MISNIFLAPLAFVFAAALAPTIYQRLQDPGVAGAWRGVTITLLTAALMSMAFTGIAGGDGHPVGAFAMFMATSLGFGWAAWRRRAGKSRPSVEQIDRLLPQTQCGQCGYPGCKPYATAIAAGAADINQCPPGGDAGVRALARLLGREAKPLNPANGIEKPKAVALIREPECIGCTKCIQACPVDAIVGASKSMHVVVADLCTGCELCIPPCPVDCIDLVAIAPVRS
jgi:electron transport complex protein RnfB